jgi:PAS domain S-box-containing protein
MLDAVDYQPPIVSDQATLREAITKITQSNHDYVVVMDCEKIRGTLTAKEALRIFAQQLSESSVAETKIADLLPDRVNLIQVGKRSINPQIEEQLRDRNRKLKQVTEALNSVINERDRLAAALQESTEKFNRIFTAAPIGADTIWDAVDFDSISAQHKAMRKEAETALRESEAKLQDIIDNAPAVIYLKDLQGRYILINRKFQILFHLSRDEVLGRPDRDIFPKDLADRLWGNDLQVIAEELPKEFEETISQPEGDLTFLSIKFPLHNAVNQFYAVCGISTDISDRKRSEQLVAASLEEKEVLLKEIHHRVKNNMHVISNLLDLQTQYIDDASTIDLFADSQNRINSMALIHEQLYQSPSLRAINFDRYLKDLVDNLLASYSFHPVSVQLQLDLEPVTVNIETAMPCGLIVNELISNSLKYAFLPDLPGIIRLQLHIHPDSKERLTDRQFVLIVGDNGVGICKSINWQNTNSLGLRLVRMLTRQLEGEIELDLKEGTLFRLTFTELQYKERL